MTFILKADSWFSLCVLLLFVVFLFVWIDPPPFVTFIIKLIESVPGEKQEHDSSVHLKLKSFIHLIC